MNVQRRRDLAFDAQRVRIVGRFVTAAKLPRVEVEDWIQRWQEQAERAGVRRDSHAYWDACRRWIARQRVPVAADSDVA